MRKIPIAKPETVLNEEKLKKTYHENTKGKKHERIDE
jgi:hypothetical protein